MKKHLFLFTGLLFASGGLYAQNAQPVTIKDGFNQDVIIEDAGMATKLSTQSDVAKFQGLDDQGWDLFTASVREQGALTSDGSFTTKHATYKVNISTDKVVNNALVLKNPSVTGAINSGTLTLETPLRADEIYVVGISANGNATVQVTLEYTDGTTSDPVNFQLNNWDTHNGREEALSGLDRIASKRIDNNMAGAMSNSHNFSLYETGIKADTTKEVKSIFFSNASLQGLASILGVAYTYPGQNPDTPDPGDDDDNKPTTAVTTTPVAIADGFNEDVIAETKDVQDGKLTSVTQSDANEYQGLDSQGFALFTTSVQETGALSGDDGVFHTARANYQAPVDANNALVLKGNNITSTNGTLTFATPVKADTIYITGISAQRASTVKVVATYDDDSVSDVVDFNLNNWDKLDYPFPVALDGLDRIASKSDRWTSAGSVSNSHNFRLYEVALPVDKSKSVTSIYIDRDDSPTGFRGSAQNGYVSILGVSAGVVKVLDGKATPIAVSDGFNSDVIAENVDKDAQGHLTSVSYFGNQTADGIDNGGCYLFTSSVRELGSLCGDDGAFTTNHGHYTAPVDTLNALVLKDQLTNDGTLTLAKPVTADSIYVVGISGDAASNIDVDLVYSDNTTSDVANFYLSNWDTFDARHALTGLDRIYSRDIWGNKTGDMTNSQAFQLFETGVKADASKTIVGVHFKRHTNDGHVAVLGVAGINVTEQEGPVTAIKNINTDSSKNASLVGIYSINGAKQSRLQKGLNIVKYADGSARKVIVK